MFDRVHKEIGRFLRTHCHANHKNWIPIIIIKYLNEISMKLQVLFQIITLNKISLIFLCRILNIENSFVLQIKIKIIKLRIRKKGEARNIVAQKAQMNRIWIRRSTTQRNWVFKLDEGRDVKAIYSLHKSFIS